LLIAVIFIIPAVIFTFTVFFALFDGPELSWNVVLYGSILGLGIGALVANSQGMLASRARMLQEVSDINDQLYWLNVRLQAELWLDQKNLALTLHNDVQATLLAAALKLKASWGEGKHSAEIVMPEVKELISRSINFATAAPDQRSLADAIARINDNWAGLITMKFTATAETQELVQRDSVTMGVLEDVLSEFQNNSLKHGQATETTAILTSPVAGVLQVAMSNNGHRIDTAVEGGLGSHFLASVSLSYKLENFDRGVRLTVKLPVSTDPS
jgi:signal transduction histidine kinase